MDLNLRKIIEIPRIIMYLNSHGGKSTTLTQNQYLLIKFNVVYNKRVFGEEKAGSYVDRTYSWSPLFHRINKILFKRWISHFLISRNSNIIVYISVLLCLGEIITNSKHLRSGFVDFLLQYNSYSGRRLQQYNKDDFFI